MIKFISEFLLSVPFPLWNILYQYLSNKHLLKIDSNYDWQLPELIFYEHYWQFSINPSAFWDKSHIISHLPTVWMH